MVKIGTSQYINLLHSSQRAQQSQMTALRHMATGLRVESGKDDPGNLIAAATLRSEKQALQTANEVSGRAAGLVAVADDALDSMGNAIRRLRTIQLEADNNYISVAERGALQDEADDLIRHIDELSKDTEYNGIKVFQEPVTGEPFHPDNIGEVGATQIVQPDGAAWNTQSLSEEYEDPIVIAGPIGQVGGQSAHIRLRDVESDQFQFQTEEWEYLDGFHLTETFFWMVHEEGVHELSDGTVIEAGRVMVDGSAATVGLNASFTGTPLVFATLVTNNDNTAVNARVSGVSAGGFTLDLQEQELFEKGSSADAAHGLEEVNYVAITSPTGPTGSGNTAVVDPTKGVNYQTGIQSGVTQNFSTVNFSAVPNPLFIGQPQTLNETDTINLRHRNLTGSSIQIRNQEDQSLDGEESHAGEDVAWIVYDRVGRLDATPDPVPEGIKGEDIAPRRPGDPSQNDPQTTWVFNLGTTLPKSYSALRIPEIDAGYFGDGTVKLNQMVGGGEFALTRERNDGTAVRKALESAQEQVQNIRTHIGRFEKDVIDPARSWLSESAIQAADAQGNVEDADFAHEIAEATRAGLLQQTTNQALPIAFERDRAVIALVDSTTLPQAVRVGG